MGVIEQIAKMKREGRDDEEIVSSLQNQGISPRAINDALNQAQIKKAVADIEEPQGESSEIPSPSEFPTQRRASQTQEEAEPVGSAIYRPKTHEMEEENYYSPQNQSSQQQYGYGEEYNYGTYNPSSANTDMMVEISEQIASEKIKETKKQIDDLNEFKVLTLGRIETLTERLKRIEAIIDKLQMAILEKIGSYGENLDSIKKEMSMMQDSFSRGIHGSKSRTGNQPEKVQTNRYSSFSPQEEIRKSPEKAKTSRTKSR